MHNPILHGGGVVKFVPHIANEIDSVIVNRMTEYYKFDWDKSYFSKNDLNDFHINWCNTLIDNWVDFIDESGNVDIVYGEYDVIWATNPYYNNVHSNNTVYTDHLNDSICKLPDFLYCQRSKMRVSSNIHDYIYDEDTYVQVFEETLEQRTFLYVVQVTLKNNDDRVKGCGAFSISDIAEKVNLESGLNEGSISYIFNTKKHDDIIVGSFTSFGLPKFNPYEFRYKSRNGLIDQYTNKNILYIQLIYSKGRKIVCLDVSQQMILQPTGGLILAEIDINEHHEPIGDIDDPFDVFVKDYENINEYYNKFN